MWSEFPGELYVVVALLVFVTVWIVHVRHIYIYYWFSIVKLVNPHCNFTFDEREANSIMLRLYS